MAEPLFNRLCLVGIGLIGSSIARVAKKRGDIAKTIVVTTKVFAISPRFCATRAMDEPISPMPTRQSRLNSGSAMLRHEGCNRIGNHLAFLTGADADTQTCRQPIATHGAHDQPA